MEMVRSGEGERRNKMYEIVVNEKVALDVIVRFVFMTFLAPRSFERINKKLPDVRAFVTRFLH